MKKLLIALTCMIVLSFLSIPAIASGNSLVETKDKTLIDATTVIKSIGSSFDAKKYRYN